MLLTLGGVGSSSLYMAVVASRVGDVADLIEVRGSRHAPVLTLALLVSTIGLAMLPPVIGVLVIAGLLG